MKNNYFKLFSSIFICLLAGLIGSLFTRPAIDTWYAGLDKPFFNPPNWIFAPTWTILYILIGIAFYLIWQSGQKREQIKLALIVFIVHLFLNAGWSIIFFGWQNSQIAFIDIVILWMMIAWLLDLFYKIRKSAMYLLIPYFLWVSFALLLNLSIWQLNYF
ncbi:MAG: TspO protein [Candidatus Komeilibacteria bacterium CG11_big_fil_rev_8_21_14_0_20_36_20]|uniref:TspO protein n=1 Tax=Candidatus Komeilibacteria bacterium CG11_big_fil_rev_8_21_14_0_20_36_20 TaxID=1974477 RepID=A0A2H0NEL1_9BACT|nr:MAG: TspO protein [Candidatus Komeilibacteria bacterium CG11_big_fil_rev_8_21_14_0_20_36_20]PIR81552.1 MAG: TspO protein [Candidatus Komeilibacteria bacterium CG10_big_fil_rev_8_21_14_0_10_36_65]PJC55460.1 MAG: TspO protein [Candidatus Komeilibacteria bacterium CG_4_9_14_0_2_um_filter_36_13]